MNRPAVEPVAKPFRSILGVMAAILVAALFVAGMRSYRDLAVQRARESSLESRLAETRLRIEELERRIDLLRTDPGTLEKIAREDLGMARPGDLVVRLDAVDPPRDPAPDA